MSKSNDPHAGFVASMRFYRSAGITPKGMPDTWRKLWNEISHAYRTGELSDNEWDDLRNRMEVA